MKKISSYLVSTVKRTVALAAVGLLTFSQIQILPAVMASPTDGTIDPNAVDNKYAWSDNAGWINFGTGVGQGDVHVTDAGMTGYAWSDNYGWINLAPTGQGVANDPTGNLSGYAWGESLGWINFDNVSIDSNGFFMGTASGTTIGTLNFDCPTCVVETDYRPSATTGGRRRLAVSAVTVDEEPEEETPDAHASAGADPQGNQPESGFIPLLSSRPADIDGDGILNIFDEDVDGDGLHNADDEDDDGDGILDGEDSTPLGDGTPPDIDGDGIANELDTDLDGDGLPNTDDSDIDGDGTVNIFDEDVDADGFLFDQDDDDDMDGVPDADDPTPTGRGTFEDIDGDGLINEEDDDIDGDGRPNAEDTALGVPERVARKTSEGGEGSRRRCHEQLVDIDNDEEWNAITFLLDLGHFLCPERYFNPTDGVTRADAIKLNALSLGLHGADLLPGDLWYSAWQRELLDRNIIKQNVSPERFEPRADFLAFVLKTKGVDITELPQCTHVTYLDVMPNRWECPMLQYAAEKKWIDDDPLFFPHDLATRSWAAGVLYRAFYLMP